MRNADAIVELLSRVPGQTILCMETTAGSGTAIGATFEDLAAVVALVPEPLRSRISVCVDLSRTLPATISPARTTMCGTFDDTLGLSRLKVMHLNDSKTPFASRRDRHVDR